MYSNVCTNNTISADILRQTARVTHIPELSATTRYRARNLARLISTHHIALKRAENLTTSTVTLESLTNKHIESNMKANKKLLVKCKNIVNKYQRKKDLNISIELPENHIFNKMAQDGKINSSVTKSKRRNEKVKLKFLGRKESTLKGLKPATETHFYETISRLQNNRNLHSMPSNLKMLPLIPFWRSSFEIIDYGSSEEELSPSPGSGTNLTPAESLYVTMRPRQSCNEPIYV